MAIQPGLIPPVTLPLKSQHVIFSLRLEQICLTELYVSIMPVFSDNRLLFNSTVHAITYVLLFSYDDLCNVTKKATTVPYGLINAAFPL